MPVGPWSWCPAYEAFISSVNLSNQNLCSIVFNHSSACNGSAASLKIGGFVSMKSLKLLYWFGSDP
jgi:hypothetical protein